MTSLFSHDAAAGTTLAGAQDEFEEAAALCLFARALVGGDVTREEILAELQARGIEGSEENLEQVYAAMDRQRGRMSGHE